MDLYTTDSSCLWEYPFEELILSFTNLTFFHLLFHSMKCVFVFRNAFQFEQLLGEWKSDVTY